MYTKNIPGLEYQDDIVNSFLVQLGKKYPNKQFVFVASTQHSFGECVDILIRDDTLENIYFCQSKNQRIHGFKYKDLQDFYELISFWFDSQ